MKCCNRGCGARAAVRVGCPGGPVVLLMCPTCSTTALSRMPRLVAARRIPPPRRPHSA